MRGWTKLLELVLTVMNEQQAKKGSEGLSLSLWALDSSLESEFEAGRGSFQCFGA